MKKIIIGIVLFIIVIIGVIFINKDITKTKNNNLEKVKVAEVAHSIFYAPQYIAVKKGYFKINNNDYNNWENINNYPQYNGIKVTEKGEPLFIRLDVEQEVEYLKEIIKGK